MTGYSLPFDRCLSCRHTIGNKRRLRKRPSKRPRSSGRINNMDEKSGWCTTASLLVRHMLHSSGRGIESIKKATDAELMQSSHTLLQDLKTSISEYHIKHNVPPPTSSGNRASNIIIQRKAAGQVSSNHCMHVQSSHSKKTRIE